MDKPKVTVVGFGRFGRVLLKLLKSDFQVTVFRRGDDIEKALKNNVIFYCVPIGKFEKIIKSHEPFLSDRHLIIDTLSVKMLPARVLKQLHRKTKTRSLLTHPMFGPDSTKNGFPGLSLVMHKFTATSDELLFWKRFFSFKGLNVIEMSPQRHDRLAANSQGLTHFIGRLLERLNFQSTEIDTQGAKKLHEVMDQTCNDTKELFSDLQTHNPYTVVMREKLIRASKKIIGKLLPQRVDKNFLTIGIQGGEGSFNQSAVNKFISSRQIKKPKIKFLFTTKRVLTQLNRGKVDLGVFAIANSRGGLVDESLAELGNFSFKIIDRIVIPIEHCLMKRKDVPIEKISKIMAHDQVFKQCKDNLSSKHKDKKLVQGKGDLIDTANAARALSLGRIPKVTAILGSKKLAELFDLEIIEPNLQDDPNNKTTFLVVSR
jgi:prephenate dehydrogenase